jgi:hypothetical protein
MEFSHKTQAALQFLVPTAIGYVLIGGYFLDGQWPSISVLEEKSSGLVIMGISAMLVQDLIPKPIKEFLIFLRLKHRLPGHRAFTELYVGDPKVTRERIPDIKFLIKQPPEIQQREFYRLYREVADVRSVSHYSQRYIAWRDLSTLLIVLSIVSVPVLYSVDYERAIPAGIALSIVTLIAYTLTSYAARNVAADLVVQVLTLAAEGGKGK